MNLNASANQPPDGLSAEGMLLAECLMTGDYPEARRTAQLLRHGAQQRGLGGVQRVAERVLLLLGPDGSEPSPGLGAAVLALARAVEHI